MSDEKKFVTNGQEFQVSATDKITVDGKQIDLRTFGLEGLQTRGLQGMPRTGKELPPVQTAPKTIVPMRGPKLPPIKK